MSGMNNTVKIVNCPKCGKTAKEIHSEDDVYIKCKYCSRKQNRQG